LQNTEKTEVGKTEGGDVKQLYFRTERQVSMNIGQRIKALRVAQQLTQEELASRTDLTKGFISQLENDSTSPSIATLTQILDVLGISLSNFFREFKGEQVVFGRAARVLAPESNEKVRFELLVPKAINRSIDPALVTLEPGARTIADKMHEGEEFGYVITGEIVLVLDGAEHRVKAGESFSFIPSVPHWIENRSEREAKVVWITNPPTH
jgi:transcriptional regulator with XRE-family HTH domain